VRPKKKKKKKKKKKSIVMPKGVVIKRSGFVQQIIINPKSRGGARKRQPNGFKGDGGVATNLTMFRSRDYPPPHNYYMSQYNLAKIEGKIDNIPNLASKYEEQTKLIRDSSSKQDAEIKLLNDTAGSTRKDIKALQDGVLRTHKTIQDQQERIANQLGQLKNAAIKNKSFGDTPPTIDLHGAPTSVSSIGSSRVSELSVESKAKKKVSFGSELGMKADAIHTNHDPADENRPFTDYIVLFVACRYRNRLKLGRR
jgi:hypothetical protein